MPLTGALGICASSTLAGEYVVAEQGNCRRRTGYLPGLRSDGGLPKPIVVGSKVAWWVRYFREPWKVPEVGFPQSYWAVRPRGPWEPPPRYKT